MKAIIVGAGIGGLTTALFFQKNHIDCEIYEQVPELRELGVGITLQTNAVKELARLGLLPALDEVAIRSEHLYYATRRGRWFGMNPAVSPPVTTCRNFSSTAAGCSRCYARQSSSSSSCPGQLRPGSLFPRRSCNRRPARKGSRSQYYGKRKS